MVAWGPRAAWGVSDITTPHLRTQKTVQSSKTFGLADFSGMTPKDRKTLAGVVPIQLGMDSPKSFSAQQPRQGPEEGGWCARHRPFPVCVLLSYYIRRSMQCDPLQEAGYGQAPEEP